jgi:hypothetical protein
MKKLLFILGTFSSLFGVGYFFVKPKFMVAKLDGQSQNVKFLFDGSEITYPSGFGIVQTETSRFYKLTIKDQVFSIGGIAVSGKIVATIEHFGTVIKEYTIKPSDYGFYLWNWTIKK